MLGTLLVTHVTIASKSSQPARQNPQSRLWTSLETDSVWSILQHGKSVLASTAMAAAETEGRQLNVWESLVRVGAAKAAAPLTKSFTFQGRNMSKLFQNSMLQISF